MVTTTRHAPPRLELRLRSRQILRDAMSYRRMTVRELSLACGRESYRSTLGHLHSGARSTCGPHLARRIEESLNMPPGSMFEPAICSSNSEPVTPRGRKAA